ncbi:hypothetical protein ACUTR7_01715 [Delftia sp. NA_296.1]|uniref:hypothetical protein n=1 Tax=Delftia sp. NA_296.1 TaxID=3415648 RepID=UPI0040456F14
MAASALAAGCSSSTDQMRVALATPVAAKALDPADPTDRSQYRYLYAVYCNGRVDRLDLKNQAKTGSFQLSERSGKPAAIAALPRPGVRPGGCLARPVVTQDAQGSSDGLVNIIASSRLDPDADGRKPYQLLTFALPGWTLQQARNLGSFDALPRLARAADGTLAVLPQDKDTAAAMAAQAQAWTAADALAWTSAQAWSAGNVLLIYALPGQRGMPGGLAAWRFSPTGAATTSSLRWASPSTATLSWMTPRMTPTAPVLGWCTQPASSRGPSSHPMQALHRPAHAGPAIQA